MDDSRAASTATVSEHDRDYMRRLGRWKRESHEQARARHLALPPTERLLVSATWTATNARLLGRERRDEERPELFYERARQLGLYRA